MNNIKRRSISGVDGFIIRWVGSSVDSVDDNTVYRKNRIQISAQLITRTYRTDFIKIIAKDG